MFHNNILPVFLVILTGYILSKIHKGIEIDSLLYILVHITAPALIFTSLVKSSLALNEFLGITIATSLIILVTGLAVFMLFGIFKVRHKGLYLPMIIGNTGYIGYPIALAVYGVKGLSIAIIFDTIASFFLYSFGIWIVHENNEIREVFRVPLIYAVIIGMAFSIIKLPVPSVLFTPLESIGTITIPLALIVLGYKLASIKISHFKISILASLFKIAGMFTIAFFVLYFLHTTGITKSVILLQASMPSAVMSMVLCQKYKRDPEIVTSVVLVSTIISIFTIPLVLRLLQ